MPSGTVSSSITTTEVEHYRVLMEALMPSGQASVPVEIVEAEELRPDQVRMLRVLTLAGALQRESDAIQIDLEVEENGPYQRDFYVLDPDTHDYIPDLLSIKVWWFYTFRDGVSTSHTTVGTTTINPWEANLYLVGDRLELRDIVRPARRQGNPFENDYEER